MAAKGASPQPEKVSLSELPTDSVAKIASATAGQELGIAASAKGANAPTEVTAADAGTEPATGPAVSDLSSKAGPSDPSPCYSGHSAPSRRSGVATTDLATATAVTVTPVADPTTGSVQLTNANAQSVQTTQTVQAVQATSGTPLQATGSNTSFSASHGGPGGKAEPDASVQGIAQTGSGGGQAGGQSAGAQSGQNQSQSQTEDVIREIAQHTEKLALRTASGNVTVHLQTEDDTNITMNVKFTRGEVQAQFMTNNEGLRNALHQNRTQLAQGLETKGMNLGQVSVGLKNSSSRQDQPAQRQNQGGRAAVAATTQLKGTGTARASFATSADGVDLWI